MIKIVISAILIFIFAVAMLLLYACVIVAKKADQQMRYSQEDK